MTVINMEETKEMLEDEKVTFNMEEAKMYTAGAKIM